MYGDGSSPVFDESGSLRRQIKPLPKRRRTSRNTVTSSQGSSVLLAAQPHPPAFSAMDQQQGSDDDDRDNYSDHLSQPNNTKKRKVPANIQPSLGHDLPDPEDEPDSQAVHEGLTFPADPSGAPPATTVEQGQQNFRVRKARLRRSTKCGLQLKDILRVRKRQLASVLSSLEKDTKDLSSFAIDQALSSVVVPAAGSSTMTKPKVRLSKRRKVRMARHTKEAMKHPHPDFLPLISHFDFEFTLPSPTDRLAATKSEVASLRAKFEEELKKQAIKAAQLAASTKAIMSAPAPPSKGTRKRTADRHAKGRVGRALPPPSSSSVTPDASFLDQSLVGLNKPKSKKKKRSALANASNPHHLRNYVPSRLPGHTSGLSGAVGGGGGTGNSGNLQPSAAQLLNQQQNLLSPLPIAFLTAEIPPRRKTKKNAGGKKSYKNAGTPGVSALNNPMDEWICAYCEYELFYGDDADYRRAIRNRKKILRRRRRARERASAAASGNSAPYKANKENLDDDELYDDDEEDGYEEGEDDPGYAVGVPGGVDDIGRWQDSGGGG
ncbi:hypothetical protein DL96DRAFT_686541 [Flagelloscypha sp. PMI_526]|nr:hypothetical protein DL96DRAFT_686541 [Flagelloscypha sp. PMI_526]